MLSKKLESQLMRKQFEILSYPKGGKENPITFLDHEGNPEDFYIEYLPNGKVRFCLDPIRVSYKNIEELMYGSIEDFVEAGYMRKNPNYHSKSALVSVKAINLDGQSVDGLLEWFEEEKQPEHVRRRFGRDEEAIKFFPDDYYEKLERDWLDESVRNKNPLDLIQTGKKYHINDGWHRVALCHLHKIELVPALVEIP